MKAAILTILAGIVAGIVFFGLALTYDAHMRQKVMEALISGYMQCQQDQQQQQKAPDLEASLGQQTNTGNQ